MPKPTPKNNKKLHKGIAIAVVATPVILAILFVITIYQVPQYSYYFVKCGFIQPVKVVGRGFGSDMLNYVSSAHSGYNDHVFTVQGYFCSDKEAQGVGLKSLYTSDGRLNPDSTPATRLNGNM